MNDKKIRFKLIFFLIMGVIVLLAFPFVVERIIFNETLFPFSLPIKISREGWFSFIASYVGAICTAFLGWLALWQNKKYREASDRTDCEFQKLQGSIKDLVKTNTDLTAENKNIQEEVRELLRINATISEALLKLQNEIYSPKFSYGQTVLIANKGHFYNCMNFDKDIFAATFFGISGSDYNTVNDADLWKNYIKKKCGYIAFPLINDGEKDIISFSYKGLGGGQKKYFKNCFSRMVDIGAHKTVWIMLVFPRSIFKNAIKELNENKSFELYFSLKNTIGESFVLLAKGFASGDYKEFPMDFYSFEIHKDDSISDIARINCEE